MNGNCGISTLSMMMERAFDNMNQVVDFNRERACEIGISALTENKPMFLEFVKQKRLSYDSEVQMAKSQLDVHGVSSLVASYVSFK